MGFLNRIFKKKSKVKPIKITPKPDQPMDYKQETEMEEVQFKEETWLPLPEYIDADPEETKLASVIATVIAAGDQPESRFVVKKVQKRNPEFTLVTVIATLLAAETQQSSQWAVKKILKKQEDSYAQKI